jgi:cold shock CspA family protein
MARSGDSINKKEAEKKRQQKKKEKVARKEERKASSTKGQNVDQMAYIDENGNLSDTPPDPTKRREIDASEISLDITHNVTVEEEARTGTVTFYNDAKGFGFIKDLRTGESIFVHTSGMLEPIGEGNKVTFSTEKTPRGLSAIGVKKA